MKLCMISGDIRDCIYKNFFYFNINNIRSQGLFFTKNKSTSHQGQPVTPHQITLKHLITILSRFQINLGMCNSKVNYYQTYNM